ncbi:hypothetical protein [Embleya sp. NPDC059259]|uniref:terpene synthase family protein n=1 Tax=unclassified Embleya TaxID=2699296 RepID=UPI003697F095
MRWRRTSPATAAVTPGLFFIELAGGYELDATDFADPWVRGLREMVVALVGWDNDITSYNKELYRATHYGYPSLQNLITVLAHHHTWPTERALAEATAMRDQVMEPFLRLHHQLHTHAHENLRRYPDGLTQWVRGYLDWSSHTPRYSDPHTPNDHRTTQPDFTITAPTHTKHPRAPRPPRPPRPLTIPTIAYWWELPTSRD